ncbi:bacteriocin fulvocin C-related protein [Streptosporangium sp. NPDC002721]|uniref:bacteriocin fulvocin C-related protein n=1 Tax=Streptosporangium sp. NPDC002721 TaxID=3366188 RepID=UPI0036B1241A
MEYRQAIFSSLSPKSRSGLWVEHLKNYRTSHGELSEKQISIIDRATALLSSESTFIQGRGLDTDRRLREVREAAVEAFGHDEARTLIATLGPTENINDTQAAALADCQCSNIDDWCSTSYSCVSSTSCRWTPFGCGTGWVYQCNGKCL